jgi:hypothetical protein
MTSVAELITRLLDEANSHRDAVIIDTEDGNFYRVESISSETVDCPRIQDSMNGPLAHNESVIAISVTKLPRGITLQ